VSDACLAKLYKDTQGAVDELRNNQKVDIVIVLAHAGTDPSTPANGESYKLAQNVTGIDLILSGHTHLLVPRQTAMNIKTGNQVIITEPGAYGENVTKITLTIDKSSKVLYGGTDVIPINNTIAADPAMQRVVDSAIKYLETVEDVPGKNSFLKRSISEILGQPVIYNGTLGSL